ncbi:hypothetical protein EHS25_008188 [Saitozyma podzolica]|uniref:Mediator of RNA polymerase II transcription subunit 19 n=1 Tax=Saitozyma podzolica TaxID=1890683 RepID=A0A427YNN7_9TREE|nr:hypothetical protein EHS25_008188 [Saitozyma podzolica]
MAEGGPHPVEKSRLILPAWDVAPLKRIHPSHDIMSLMGLETLYNTYVRPFADPVSEAPQGMETGPVEAGAAAGKKGGPAVRRKKLEKGYTGLLEDSIDLLFPPAGPPPTLWDGEIIPLTQAQLAAARLEAGLKQDGYVGGEKVGAREEQARRQRKRAKKSMTIAPEALPSPGLDLPPSSEPSTPLLPVPPPSRPGIPPHARRMSVGTPSGPRAFGRGTPVRIPGRPLPPAPPGLPARPVGTPGGGAKRPSEAPQGGSGPKRPKGMGSRSASPMPMPQGLGPPRPPKPGMRARTEDV